jgi:hypothetical protein
MKEQARNRLIFVIIIAIAFVCIAIQLIPFKHQPERKDKLQTAYYMAIMVMEKQLKAPATAKFASKNESNISKLGDNLYEVTSYVDAQNSFGALIRTSFTIVVKDEGETWQLISQETKP